MGTSEVGFDGLRPLVFPGGLLNIECLLALRICLRMVIRMRWSLVCMHLGEFPEHSDPGQVHVHTTELKLRLFVVV